MMSLSRRRLLQLGYHVTLSELMLSGLANADQKQMPSSPLENHTTSLFDNFKIRQYLKFSRYKNSDGIVVYGKNYLPDAWYAERGLLPINLVYGSRFLNGEGSSATLDIDKLCAIARKADPQLSVSLDAEAWDENHFYPDQPLGSKRSIVENLAEVVHIFKQASPYSQVGLYSEVPQNTYGFDETTTARYDVLNPEYAAVASEVDYYSPALYNYGHYDGTAKDDQRWLRAAEYAVHACKQLDSINHTAKPILPYISPGWQNSSGSQRYLSYEQMHFRLTALKSLNTKGCILWLSSSAKEQGSLENLTLDPQSGWLKAAIDFSLKNHAL